MRCGCAVKVSISVAISLCSPFQLLTAISSSVLILFSLVLCCFSVSVVCCVLRLSDKRMAGMLANCSSN